MLHNRDGIAVTDDIKVELVDTFAGFADLRDAWDALEERDPESTYFLSWEWMAEAFRANPMRWSVMVVRDPSDLSQMLGILPLKYRVHWSRSAQQVQTEVEAAGRFLWSEYTGFLCDPRHEAGVLKAFADQLTQMPWIQVSMRYITQTRRAQLFTESFDKDNFTVRYPEYRLNDDETDNLLCPQVALPGDFEDYLSNQVSASRRQRLRRTYRNHIDTGDYHIAEATADTLEEDLDALLTFWKHKWLAEKGATTTERTAENYRKIFRTAHKNGALHLPVMFKGDQRLGALGHMMDRKNGIMHFMVAGRDTEAEERFISETLHFHSIDRAISMGFGCYDFCHGNEPYKYSYGSQDRQALYFQVRRRSPKPDQVFDVLCTGDALKRIGEFIKDGKAERAEKACAQLSRIMS